MKRGVRELRIVGGSLRGRKWTFPDVPALRPTPDRVRETLFNWLAQLLPGSRVLDLFAGSGALGFEALSRGANSATLVESDRAAAAQLQDVARRFGLTQAHVACTDAQQFLSGLAPAAFEVIFLDPPFAAGLMQPVLAQIAAGRVLTPGGYCYLELAASQALPTLPGGWVVHRSGTAGEVGYYLLHESSRDLPGNV
jgi:16S rRNA (guanine966-N2)-methyltransferase